MESSDFSKFLDSRIVNDSSLSVLAPQTKFGMTFIL